MIKCRARRVSDADFLMLAGIREELDYCDQWLAVFARASALLARADIPKDIQDDVLLLLAEMHTGALRYLKNLTSLENGA
jgi:hypothetical protein